ncbi:Hsp33 family molecular chaperone HslO [Luteimonas sp. R10]|uniref:Hsp33 family molecular chaperone HslO n=1 Tax=Luteimonas sp. R10 TaxID=3108176 RepID=UPI00308B7F3F|nr:Hsp33 family molecular chaperone HslO [Luteimonas sp. R10]
MTPSRPDSDCLVRFLLPDAGVRGVRVHLHDTWRDVRSGDDAPAAATELLGEACAAAALFTGHAKIDGRLSVQLRGEGALRTLFAECTAAGTLRGIVRLGEGVTTLPRGLRAAGEGATLAITIENPRAGDREPQRYQGLVALASDSLSPAFEDYFRQSEQLPTRVALAADGTAAAGLMLQKLPGDEGDADGWNRASALFDTLTAPELLACPTATLLQRLFHQESPQLLDRRPLRFGCSCSRERVAAVLQSLGQEEARAALVEGRAQVRCEFCGQGYAFDRAAIDALFTAGPAPMTAPTRLQ